MPHLPSSLEHGPDPGRGVLGDHARHAPDAHQRARHRAGPDPPDPDTDGRGRHQDPGAAAGRDGLLVPVLHAQMAASGPTAGQEPAKVAAPPRVTPTSIPFISVKPRARPPEDMKIRIQCVLTQWKAGSSAAAGLGWP